MMARLGMASYVADQVLQLQDRSLLFSSPISDDTID